MSERHIRALHDLAMDHAERAERADDPATVCKEARIALSAELLTADKCKKQGLCFSFEIVSDSALELLKQWQKAALESMEGGDDE